MLFLLGTLHISARKVDKKSYEVELSSLPEAWKQQLPEDVKAKAGSLNAISEGASLAISSACQEAFGRKLSKKEKLRAEVNSYYKALDPLMKESYRVNITATFFSISPATVRRILKEVQDYGILGKPKAECKRSKWDQEAEEYMKAWYLSFIKQTSIDSKQAAYDAVVKQAKESNWNIGSRSSAYVILSEIPELIKRYAIAGSRALDNFFYIKRDWSSLVPSQIWIGDQHICDFWVVDKSNTDKWRYFRPTIYAWEDGATRCITGLAIDEDYNSDTVLESLKMGIRRFGFFDCTYNDNGTSECSKAATQVIDELIILSDNKSHMKDISELYRTQEGCYVTEDEDGNIISIEETPEEWKRKHRRIYANVKNAKTKPIERLFGSIENKMAQRGVPGHVVTPGAPADQEEKESMALDYQKKHDMILTLEQFTYELVKGIDEYEHSYHATLKMTPWEAVHQHIERGWKAVRPASEDELDFIFLARTRAKIRKGRVTINGIDYKGEDLKVVVGQYADVGLNLHEGEYVDLRYSKTNPEIAYAVFPNSQLKIRPLKPVESIDMLDDEKMKEQIRWKRNQMKAVRDAFKILEAPLLEKTETKVTKQVQTAVESSKMVPEAQIEAPRIHSPERKRKELKLHASESERYQWILDRMIDGMELTEEDLGFKAEYEATSEFESQRSYWETYTRLGGN